MANNPVSRTAKAHERSRLGRAVVIAVVLCLFAGIVVAFRHFSTDEQQDLFACANKLYSPYDPKNLAQCMAVCIACSRGVKTTCSTSCTLKGAR